jgi:hypothetical protein
MEVLAMLPRSHDRTNQDTECRDVAIGSHGRSGAEKPTLAAGRRSRRFLSIRGDNIVMTVMIFAAVIGLTRFGSHVTRQAQGPVPADSLGAGMVVRAEPIRLWLPQTVAELVKRQAQTRSVLTFVDLQCFLEIQHQQRLWYALTTRAHLANGEVHDLTYIRFIYDNNPMFRESPGIPTNPAYPFWDLSKAAVHVIPEEFQERNPHTVMLELLGKPAPNPDRQRFP